MSLIVNADCFEYFKEIPDNSIDFIITDPPYNISKKSYFKSGKSTKFNKMSIDFGYWDKDIDLNTLFSEYYRILKSGSSIVIFYDIWKSGQIKEMALLNKFKQPRVGQWLKNNPTPINSKSNYLSNCSEYFFSFTKGSSPIFNSKYDNAIYRYPLCHGKERIGHPTQKPLALFEDIISKHTNVGGVVLDNFSGSGTTAVACINSDRNYICIERDENYYKSSLDRIEQIKIQKIYHI